MIENVIRATATGPTIALALATLTGVGLLAAACGGAPGSGVANLASSTVSSTAASTTTTPSTAREAALAFSRCMRSHGVPRFPDPDADGSFPPLEQQQLGVSKQASLAAQESCKHLLPAGSGGATPQQRQQKLAFGLVVARCLRAHGYPTFPDPGSSSQAIPRGIDPGSPRFERTESSCEQSARKALGVG